MTGACVPTLRSLSPRSVPAGSTDFVAERTVGFGIYAFRGGGGECASCAVPALARDVCYDLDHIYLAWP